MIKTNSISMLIIAAAKAFIMPRWKALKDSEISAKQGDDVVTAADTDTESFIASFLADVYPDAVVVGEEAAAADPSIVSQLAWAEHAFVIDPLDGTRSFVRGRENFAVMLAELVRGDVVRSWIYLPVTDVMFTYEAGIGVRRNGKKVERTEWLTPLGTRRGHKESTEIIGATGKFNVTHPMGSVGVAYVSIVEGMLDFFVHPTLHPWDHLAGAAMLEEIGGKVTNQNGERMAAGIEGDAMLAAGTYNIWFNVYSTEGMLA